METNKSVNFRKIMDMIDGFEMYMRAENAQTEKDFLSEQVLEKLGIEYYADYEVMDDTLGNLMVTIKLDGKSFTFDSGCRLHDQILYLPWVTSRKVVKFLYEKGLITF